MKRVKEFLIYHGEKIAVAVVALLCLKSIFGNLMQKPNELRLPNGESFVVEDERLRESLRRLDEHLKSDKVTVTPPALPDIAREVEEAHLQWQRPCSAAFLWTFYQRPPRPLTLPPLPVPTRPGQEPEAKWITAVQAIADYEVVAVAKKIAVVCKAPAGIRWPKRGTLRVMLFRKYVGPVKENLDLKTAERFRVRRMGFESSTPVSNRPAESTNPYSNLFGVEEEPAPRKSEPKKKSEPSVPPEAPWGPMFPGAGGMSPAPKPEKKSARSVRTPAAEPRQPAVIPEEERPSARAVEEGAEEEKSAEEEMSPAQMYVQRLSNQIKRLKNDIAAVVDMSSAEPTGWTLVCAEMPCFAEQPSMEDILLKGKLPKEMLKEPEQDDPKPDKKEGKSDKASKAEKTVAPRETGKAASGFDGLLAEPGRARWEKEEDKAGDEQLARKYKPEFVPRYYAYIDTDVEENAAYVYRFVVALKARDIPWEMRERDEYRDYVLRVDNADLSQVVKTDDGQAWQMGYLAILEEDLKNFFKSEKPAVGMPEPEETQPLQYLTRIERDPKTRAVRGLRDSQGNLTKRGFAYAAQRCCSLFTYTDLVLTPLEKRVILTTTAVSREAGEEKRTASFKVELMTGEKGKVSPLYTLPVPAATKNLDHLAWLRRGEDGKPIWPAGAERPEILSLAEYYAKVAEDLEPVPIGKRETIGRDEWDFSSGWALVDVRVCTVLKYRYRLEEDGKRVSLGKPHESQETYAVICETKEKNPRYKRLPRTRPAGAEAEDVVVEYEYIWEPALEKWIEEERRKRAARPEASKKAEPAAKAREADEATARERQPAKGE